MMYKWQDGVLSGNTQKWSSGCLMISRLLQLRSYIPAIESHSDYKSSHLLINFQLIDAAK